MWLALTETRPDYVARARRHPIQFTVPSEDVVRETAMKARDVVEKDDRKEMRFREADFASIRSKSMGPNMARQVSQCPGHPGPGPPRPSVRIVRHRGGKTAGSSDALFC